MAAIVESCAHCSKQGVGLKCCSRCKQASYCGGECQSADWKRHKKKCAPPVPLQDVAAKLDAAHAVGDWRGVLQWDGCMEELLARCSSDDYKCSKILYCFSQARARGFAATGSEDHAAICVRLEERRIPLLGNLRRFWDQGKTMCELSDILRSLDRKSEAATWYQRARDVGAAHGFFSLESTACEGLGWVAMEDHRHEEGVALLRNALVAAELNEFDDPKYELEALTPLIMALFKTNSIDEVEPLLLRYREETKAQSERERFCCEEFYSILFSALLHEVLCLCTPRLGNPYHSSAIAFSTAI